jgi:hypothetical protein
MGAAVKPFNVLLRAASYLFGTLAAIAAVLAVSRFALATLFPADAGRAAPGPLAGPPPAILEILGALGLACLAAVTDLLQAMTRKGGQS